MKERRFLEDENDYYEDIVEEEIVDDFGNEEGYSEGIYDDERDPDEIYDDEPYPDEVYEEEAYGDESYPMEEEAYIAGDDEYPVAENANVPYDDAYPEEENISVPYDDAYPAEENAGVPYDDAYPAEETNAPYDDAYPVEEAFPDEEYRDNDSEGFLALFKKKLPKKEEYVPQERPAHKGRPARKKGAGLMGIPHLLATLVWLLVILAIGVSMGRILWVCAADVLAFGRENKEVVITITEDDSLEDIAAKLQENGLVHYPDLFLMYADLAKVEEKGKISTGTFTLNTIYDYNALVKAMSPSSSSRVVVEDVLIPEGYSCRQIFERLEEKGVCTVEALEAYAATGELDEYWFLEGVVRGDKYCLEGFLFPATYDFYENSSPRQVLEKLLNAFEANFSEELNAQITTLNDRLAEMMRSNGYGEDYIAENKMTLRDVVTVASMVEEETSSIAEGYTIASVIYNRLTNQKEYPYLNIDATIIYALNGDTELTSEKMQTDSPYNTYTNKGLTPGPITNPGLASIKAALEPSDTPYYYYVFNESAGEHIFAKTYEEHQKNIANVGGQDG